jgi:ankyrin repeat protein
MKHILFPIIVLACALPLPAAEIHDAVRSGDAAKVAALVKQSPSLANEKNSGGETALHIAARADSMEITLALLDAGADVDAQDDAGFTPLNDAAETRKPKQATLLLKRGANVELANTGGVTPLLTAAAQGDAETMKLLLQAGAKLDVIPNDGLNALHGAAASGRPEAVKLLLEAGMPVDSRRPQTGATALILAAGGAAMQREVAPSAPRGSDADYTNAVEMLIKAGANVNSADSITGGTSLHRATRYGQTDTVRLLLAKKASVNARNNEDLTPLHFAADPAIVALLLDHRADMESVQKNHPSKFTPLLSAAGHGHVESLKLLLKRGANIKATAYGRGATALHIAAMSNQAEAAKVLLAAGIKVDARDGDKATPLMIAAGEGNREIAEFLIQNGANVNAKGARDTTALQIAVAARKDSLVSLLLAHGARE